MRLGVLDIGSNTVHLLVVDAHVGAAPVPALSQKTELRLAERIDGSGAITAEGGQLLYDALVRARAAAEEHGVDDLVAFATSAVREASNGSDVLAQATAAAGVDVQVLPGEEEAKLTFLAVRRWYGWSSGRLLVLDIGGGSLELAVGSDEDPTYSVSVPLGAGRVTRDFLHSDPPKRSELAELRGYARATLRPVAAKLAGEGEPDRVVATSKTFRTLARLAGAAPARLGPMVQRSLTHGQLAGVLHVVARLPAGHRAELDGVSASRARQIVGGAVVADVAMESCGVARVEICPWALREGVILRRLDWLTGS
ncbi:MAG TPA: Ppx/GppA phosphatase family protein [Mycobacteriales bacterium]|nr:Ppx/GppA phosphatase family protein [Mycobacteriales bacterium]